MDMGNSRKITVVISPLGVPKVEAIGFNGQGCTDATKAIEQALAGSGGVTREFKPEWNNSNDTSQEQHIQQW